MSAVAPARAAGTVSLAGREVARVGYGMMPLLRTAGDAAGFAAGVDLLHRAVELGTEVFDTAQFYGDGLANRLLAAAFEGSREDVVYVSKVGARPDPAGPAPMTAAQRPEELRAAVEANLETLCTDHLDVVYMRRMDRLPGLLASGDQVVPLEEQLDALAAMVDEGLVHAVGLSHVGAEDVEAAIGHGDAPVAVSNFYNLARRDDEDMVAQAERIGAVWAPYFPLGGRPVHGPARRVTKEPIVQEVADRLGATPNQVGLAWVHAHCRTGLVIAGTTSPEHLVENVGCAAVRLSAEDLAALDGIWSPERP